MKKICSLFASLLLFGCNPSETVVPVTPEPAPFELSARGLATMFASLPMGPEQLREVYDAVGFSSGNGYDEEYTLDSLLLRPGAGVGPGTKARPAGTPLREMVRRYLEEHAATRSGIDDMMELIAESGYQLYWPYSDSWDGESYPVITFDPGYGAESNYGYELSPGPDGAVITDTLIVDEALAQMRPVWVINSNSDAAFTPLELFSRTDSGSATQQEGPGTSASLRPSHCAALVGPSRSRGHGRPRSPGPLAASATPESATETGCPIESGMTETSVTDGNDLQSSRPRRLMLRSFKMLRNYDSWFGGASEFWIKVGSVEGFNASTEAELKLFSPSVTDFMIVVKRRDVGKEMPYEAIMVSDFSTQLDKIAFLVVEDDGGTRTGWKCEASVKIQSKTYGVSLDIPYNEKDDIVWRGQLSARFFEEEDIVTGRFGDVICSFELE